MALTPKQQRFVEEYLIDLNATRAAIRVGYSEKSARKIGCELLTKPDVSNAVAERRAELSRESGITVERVLQEYARLCFHDPRKFYDDEGKLLPVTELDDDTAAVLTGIDVYEDKIGDKITGITKKVRFADKKGALDSVARHLGMFNDKVEVTLSLEEALAKLNDK